MATTANLSGTAVAGYFATGHEAHRAINALVDAGFPPSAIGAAFHAGASAGAADEPARRANVGGELRDELGTTLTDVPRSNTRPSTAGASSDTTPVQVAALGGGSGTPYTGAGRPGPITGSDIHHSGLPSTTPSTLPHDDEVRGSGASSPAREEVGVIRGGLSAAGEPEYVETHGGPVVHESWGERLKHVFGGKDVHRGAVPARDEVPVKDDLRKEMNREAQDFGTGEGHLQLHTPRRYSQTAFEQSFTGYGLEADRARGFSRGLGRGGAVVTVHAGLRTVEAERILEAHGGTTRVTENGDVNGNLADSGEVEVFGTVGRDYPGYLR